MGDYPEQFKKDRKLSYEFSNLLFLLGHISVFTCIFLFVSLYFFGNSNAGISGVPLGLSFLFYIAAQSHIENSYLQWRFEQQEQKTQIAQSEKKPNFHRSPLKRMAILFVLLISVLLFAFGALPWLLANL